MKFDKKILKIIFRTFSFILGCAAMAFAYDSAYESGVIDGECGGLYEFSLICYMRTAVYFVVVFTVIPLLLSCFVSVKFFYFGSFVVLLSTYLFFYIGNGEHVFFGIEPGMPPLFGVWVGLPLYIMSLVLVLITIRAKSIRRGRKSHRMR
jgi:hypothetical protein